MRALQALEAIGKCAIVHGDSSDSMVRCRVTGLGQLQVSPMLRLLALPFVLTTLLLITCRELNSPCKINVRHPFLLPSSGSPSGSSSDLGSSIAASEKSEVLRGMSAIGCLGASAVLTGVLRVNASPS